MYRVYDIQNGLVAQVADRSVADKILADLIGRARGGRVVDEADEVRSEYKTAREDADEARAELKVLRSALEEARLDLETARNERDTARAQLGVERAALEALRAELKGARDRAATEQESIANDRAECRECGAEVDLDEHPKDCPECGELHSSDCSSGRYREDFHSDG